MLTVRGLARFAGSSGMIFRRIISHEWRLLVAERTLTFLLVAIVLLVAYGIWNGRAWVDFQKRTIAVAHAEQDTRLAAMKARLVALETANEPFDPNYFRDPRNSRAVNSVFGYQWATLTPAPLAALAIGQSDLYPYYTAITASSRHMSAQFDELQNPVQLLAGRFDLAFVIVYLLPLLVFSFSYNVLSEERENGTLGMVLAQPVTLRTLLTAKMSLRVLLVVLVSFALTAAGVLATGTSLGQDGIVAAACGWGLTVAMYSLFWLGLAVALNALGWGSATNALTLAGIWLLLVAVVPSVLNVAVAAIHPLPSRIALVEAARTAQNQSLLRFSQRAGSGEIDMDQRARSSLIQILDAEAEVQPVLRQFEDQLAKQQAQVRQWRWLSPAIVAQLALSEIAGTSGERYERFVLASEEFRSRWRAFLGPRYSRQFTAADVDAIPRFRFIDTLLAPTGK